MSKISKIRIINLNYNGNTKIANETFTFDGENTLIHLRNGGGKSVLVQNIIGLFVNPKFRQFKSRTYESYFTSKDPTIVMVEWILDNHRDKVSTGALIRKNVNKQSETESDIEMYAFTGSYSEPCEYDIDHIAFVQTVNGQDTLQKFAGCKHLLEELHNKRNDFRMYDMAVSSHRGKYYDTLSQYQVSHQEWESIICKINKDESGLSDFFEGSKDEESLVKNWFLGPIEDKLNQGTDHIKMFRENASKFIEQYRKTELKDKQQQALRDYLNDTAPIRTKIEEYIGKDDKRKSLEIEMILYAKALQEEIDRLDREISNGEHDITQLQDEIVQIIREKFSYEIYCLSDQKDSSEKEKIEKENRVNDFRDEVAELDRNITLYNLNHLYKELKDFEADKISVDTKIQKLSAENAETKEEVDAIGHHLYTHYTDIIKSLEEKRAREERSLSDTRHDEASVKEEQQNVNKELQRINRESGSFDTKVRNYDEAEASFNKNFTENLTRNIVGQYEDGLFDTMKKENDSKLQKSKSERDDCESRIKTLGQNLSKLRDDALTTESSKVRTEAEIGNVQDKISSLEKEKSERFCIMGYLEVAEHNIDDKSMILAEADKRIERLTIEKENFQQQRKDTEKEKNDLETGRTVKLPPNVEDYLRTNGFDYNYGMEWLTKNGRTPKDNETLVEKNPFIPYSILMERDTFERFSTNDSGVATGLPIPIIIKDELEDESATPQNGLVTSGSVHFYVMFNKRLLNKEELKRLIETLEDKINDFNDKISKKNLDIEEYRSYKNTINNQNFSEKLYQDALNRVEELKKSVRTAEVRLTEIRQEEKETNENIEALTRQVETEKDDIRFLVSKSDALKNIEKKYAGYVEDRDNLAHLDEEKATLLKKQSMLSDKLNNFQAKERELDSLIREYDVDISKKKEIAAKYTSYKDATEKVEIVGALEELAARHDVLVSSTSGNMDELLKEQKKAIDRIDKKKRNIKDENTSNIPEADYKDFFGTEEQYHSWKRQRAEATKTINTIQDDIVKIDKEITKLETKMHNAKTNLKDRGGSSELVERESICDIDFERRENLKQSEISEYKEALDNLDARRTTITNLYSGMGEYQDKNVEDTDVLEVKGHIIDVTNSDEEVITEYQNKMKKQVKACNVEAADVRGSIQRSLDELSRKPYSYREDMKNTLSGFTVNLKNAISAPHELLANIDRIRASIENQLKKLAEDLRSVESDREELLNEFMEYIEKVNENLPYIGKDSTITIKDRTRKMLNIIVPDWESEKEHFRIKLKYYIDNVVRDGLEILNRSENLSVLVDKRITTQGLYDNVVGIRNIDVKLYKIEETKEVLSTWSDVAKHSGGEGFVSAFVILTCLLGYMRRDITDVFKREKEGKVLIMDNPFARTYSEHLLKPLMEMAKKTNTQLICLTGMQDENIYNRFDNIYKLNTVTSSFNGNLQIMESERIAKTNSMVLSNFVTEQLSLFDVIEDPD